MAATHVATYLTACVSMTAWVDEQEHIGQSLMMRPDPRAYSLH